MKNRQPNEIPAALKNIDVKAILRKRGVFSDQSVNKELKDAAYGVATKLVQAHRHKPVAIVAEKQVSVQFDNDIITAYWQKQLQDRKSVV